MATRRERRALRPRKATRRARTPALTRGRRRPERRARALLHVLRQLLLRLRRCHALDRALSARFFALHAAAGPVHGRRLAPRRLGALPVGLGLEPAVVV